jgi:signal transduction histidine kinase
LRPFFLLLILTFVMICLAVAWLTYRQAHVSSEGDRLSRNLQQTTALGTELRRDIGHQVNLLHRYLRDPSTDAYREFERLNFKIGENQNRYLTLDIDLEERLIVERIKELQARLGLEANRILEQVRRGDRTGAVHRMIDTEQLATRIGEFLEELNRKQIGKLRSTMDDATGAMASTYQIVTAIAVCLLLVLFTFAVMLRTRIAEPVESLLRSAGEIRNANFSVRAPILREDEIGRLSREFNFMAESLAKSYAGLERRVEERTRQLRGLQEQLVQSEKMSAVGKLVSGVAHELNNPLTAIIGNIELLRNGLGSTGEDAARKQKLDVIYQETKRCSTIVTNLLQFVRQHHTRFEPAGFNDVVRAALQFREYELKTHNIRLVESYDRSEPKVLCDPHKIQQVVLVLLNNAIDAIHEIRESGTVWVEVRSDGSRVELEVRDDGTGIKDLERLFDPFYTTKDLGKGTGLGLSVCYGIAMEHEGDIRAENWEEGARFVLRLPLAPAGAEIPGDGKVVTEDLPALAGRFLVVEDEKEVAELQRSILARCGAEAEVVLGGQEAMERLTGRRFDLVVTDVRMPGPVDGIDLFDWIRNHRPELRDCVLLVSGDLKVLERAEAGELPAPCLRKPFTTEEFAQAVAGLLRGGGSQ